jgi:tRNA(Ile)-lysidine synthase TilS/MesJ
MYGIDESNANPKYERNLIRSKLDRVSIKEKDKIYKLYSKLNRKREVLNKTVDKFYNR